MKDVDGEILIYVPNASSDQSELPRDGATNDSIVTAIKSVFGRVVPASSDDIQNQWERTLNTVMRLGSAISQHAAGLKIDEIEVGFTLSAKGELLFIAEAGAEASIKFVLKPR